MQRAGLILLAAALVSVTASLGLGGSAGFGRLAMALGLNRLAERILTTPDWRGVAAYRSGSFEAAASYFDNAGDSDFNQGVALARAGKYAASLEAFDRVKALHPADREAEANFDLISSIYAGTGIDPDSFADWSQRNAGPEAEAPVGEGSGRAAATGDDVTNSGANMGLPELISRNDKLGVRKVFDDSYMIANERWLRTLEDVPGVYLAARIAEEHKRRKAAGLLQPTPEDPR